MKAVMFIALILVIVAAVPLIAIWSVNTLFGTGIEYTGWTWLAALALSMLVGGSCAR